MIYYFKMSGNLENDVIYEIKTWIEIRKRSNQVIELKKKQKISEMILDLEEIQE